MPSVNKSEEIRLFAGLRRAFMRFINGVRDGDDAEKIQRKAREFIESKEHDSFITSLVKSVTQKIRRNSQRSWRQAASKGSNGRKMYNMVTNEMNGPLGNRVWEIIADNVAYIKTVPQEWADYITKYAAREALKGRRPDEVEAELRKIMPEHMTKNLKCIARTECAKANAAIEQARAEMCGIRCYFWRCVKDERVRDSHADMDGILIFYDDPPNPEALFPQKGTKPYGNYHAGNTFNCRCYQEPVVDDMFLPDIFRYHDHGKIINITKGAFLKRFGKIA